jgi:hypothetical protein
LLHFAKLIGQRARRAVLGMAADLVEPQGSCQQMPQDDRFPFAVDKADSGLYRTGLVTDVLCEPNEELG